MRPDGDTRNEVSDHWRKPQTLRQHPKEQRRAESQRDGFDQWNVVHRLTPPCPAA
jgi:hypothetical protein